jgi:cell division transport system permease protein
MSEVKELNYISASEALENFKEKNKDNPTILESLEAIGENPLGATITVKAKNLEDYPTILKSLEDEKYKDIIQDKDKDFENNQQVIQTLTRITKKINQVGLILAVVFSLVAILVVFNTIRITIYTHREEIGIMKLVGASNIFVRAPFIFESIFYGILASLICLAILYSLINTISPFLDRFFEGYSLDVVGYFNSQFWIVAGLQLLFSVFLSMVSSAIAIGRYLRV